MFHDAMLLHRYRLPGALANALAQRPPPFFMTVTSNVPHFQILLAVARKEISTQIAIRSP
jgi:hypothetical protein